MTFSDQSERKQGILLVVVSALVFSSAGVFTKGVAAEAWSVIFWRGVAAAGFTFHLMDLSHRLLAGPL